ncbi:MAG: hypothetical protein PVI97_05690 [Candidatus Thiodiazotropha sp.]|jgi:hypothetical protein
MAKKSSKSKKTESTQGIADIVMSSASVIINEIEKAGELVLSEVKDGVVAVTEKLSSTARSVSETQMAQLMKTVIDEVEEIGNDVIDAVSLRFDQLRGEVAQKTQMSTVKKQAPRKKKKVSTKKKSTSTKKKVSKKRAVVKKKVSLKKKVSKKKMSVKKKGITKKRPASS